MPRPVKATVSSRAVPLGDDHQAQVSPEPDTTISLIKEDCRPEGQRLDLCVNDVLDDHKRKERLEAAQWEKMMSFLEEYNLPTAEAEEEAKQRGLDSGLRSVRGTWVVQLVAGTHPTNALCID